MFRFAFFAAIFVSSGFASCSDENQSIRAGIRHIESGGIGYQQGYTTFELFLASQPSQWTPFFDVRGHVFDKGKWAANAGIGLRTLRGNRAYGINSYYDYRNTGRLKANQIGVGFETLGELIDFRINGYLPLGKKRSSPYDASFKAFSGHSLILSQKIQSAMKGANAEMGFHFGKTPSWDFYAAAGPYYFIGKFAPATWGGKGRISGTFKDILTLEISDSYDRTFHNKFQGQISLNFSLGPKCKKEQRPSQTVNNRLLQPVDRQEIIVIDHTKKKAIAIDPATGLPYFFVFVNNTSSSNGTYESPYHSLAQAEANSSPRDIIYIFPGDGTTTGMNAGITLKANQKLWGSGVTQLLSTSQGGISIPPQTSTSPTITNTDVDTAGNAVTLATNNALSGLTITSALNDAIYGADAQNLDVSYCTIKNSTTFVIEASFSNNASISITNNQFLNNVNGLLLTLNGTSDLTCSNNTFSGQTSPSNVPIEIIATRNSFSAQIENNLFNNNTTGTIRTQLSDIDNAEFNLINNRITNNGTGTQSTLGSSFVVISSGTIRQCTLMLTSNTFSNNTSDSLYMHTTGNFTNLSVTASTNTMSNNGGSALVLATPVTNELTFLATDNTITQLHDNGIAVIAAPWAASTITGNITINHNTITNITNNSNGIAINQDFSTLNLITQNNTIDNCEGTGILSYANIGIASFHLNIADNKISNCQNLSSNAASGIDIEQYTALAGSITNNTLSGNSGTAVVVGSTLTTPTACLTLTGNRNSTDYLLTNPGDGLFNLSPCNVNSTNTGTINTSGTINTVISCPAAVPCTP